jgi:hypothetical protein
MGIGLYKSLKAVYPDIKDDADAISRSVVEGVSSKRIIENRVRGVGLTNISGFLRGRGEMEIISHSGYWKQMRDGTIKTKMLNCQLCGTCVNLSIDKNTILDISDTIDVWGD